MNRLNIGKMQLAYVESVTIANRASLRLCWDCRSENSSESWLAFGVKYGAGEIIGRTGLDCVGIAHDVLGFGVSTGRLQLEGATPIICPGPGGDRSIWAIIDQPDLCP